MKNQTIEPKASFWSWLHKNRLKVVVLAFVIIIPIALIFTAYIGSYTTNRKVNFDVEQTDETVYVKKFMNPDEIDAFNLFIVWSELKHPVIIAGTEELSGGYYKFTMYYEVSENYTVKNVSVTPVLQTDWTNLRSVGTSVALSTFEKPVTVAFNYLLPVNPLLFVSVSEPNLYLKVQYTLTTGGNDVNFIEYVKFSLGEINPLNVVS
ncbi:MAG: hypothetical protein KKG64_04465 [Firmicutes bacterium]|nr:hypothetical protein [Bacillota bacterium]